MPHFRFSLRLLSLACLFVGLASATPVTWTFSGGALTDGATFSGSFVFDADDTDPYGFTVGGTILSGTITTTNGSISNGETYNLYGDTLSTNPTTFQGNQVFNFYAYDYFAGNIDESIGIFIDHLPTDAGGTIGVDYFFERRDDNTNGQQNLYFVYANAASAGVITSSEAPATPEPATFALTAAALLLAGSTRFSRRQHLRMSGHASRKSGEAVSALQH